MKLIIDLESIENKVLNIVEISDDETKEILKEALKKMSSEESRIQFEDNLALGVVQTLMKEYSDKARFRQ